MPASSANGFHKFDSDARQRLTPTLPADSDTESAPLLKLKHTANSGFGVFAFQSIEANTSLLGSAGPAVYVIYRAFRKEVCAWCFRYELGRNWKIRLVADEGRLGHALVGGIVFCREECRDAWRDEYGEVGIEAYAAVGNLVQKQANCRGWAIEVAGDDDEKALGEQEIEEAWKSAEEQASLIRTFRLETQTNTPTSELFNPQQLPTPFSRPKQHTKSQKQAFAKATTLPILNTDTLFFLLSGVLCASCNSRPSQWSALLTLNPSLYAVYPNTCTLRQVTTTFLHLTAVLPPSLLPCVTRESLEAVLARDIGNSFGIWSTTLHQEQIRAPNPSDVQEPQEGGAEMLGYGIWPAASFFNHSCSPNVSRHRIDRRWVFSSARDANEGEELCISYIRGEEDVLNVEERRMRLRDAWGFTCRCVKCLREQDEDENRGIDL